MPSGNAESREEGIRSQKPEMAFPRYCLSLDPQSREAQCRAICLCSDFHCLPFEGTWPRRLEFPVDVDVPTSSVTNKPVSCF